MARELWQSPEILEAAQNPFFFRQRMIALKSSRKPGDFRRLK